MRATTRQLREDIKNGKVDVGEFTERQLSDIKKGLPTIFDYTWHHNAQSSPNNMQLIPKNIHKIPHTGEGSISSGK